VRKKKKRRERGRGCLGSLKSEQNNEINDLYTSFL
jgi:hypothetical protein